LFFFYLETVSQANEPRSCYEIIKAIDTLYEYKRTKEQKNYEWAERIAVAALGTVYFGDRREHAHKVSIEDKIKALKAKLHDCSPY